MLYEVLRPIQKRLWLSAILRYSIKGLLAGVAVALVLAIARMAHFHQLHWAWPVAASAAGLGLGMIVGVFHRGSQQQAAHLIDRHYDLKDGSISTLQFLHETDQDQVRRLQIHETESHLQQVDPAKCAPIAAPRSQVRWAMGLTMALAAILVGGNFIAPDVVARSTLPLAQTQSQQLREEIIPELEELAEQQQDPEIEKLIEELEEKLDEMENEALDEADLMATLSEMEQSLAEARDALQLDMTDAMMKSLAAAIKPSDALQQAAKAMEAEQYEEASEQLESVDPKDISDKQRRAVADNLKKMVAKLDPGQKGQLSQSISQLADGLEANNKKQCKSGLSKLAKACKKKGQCNKIGQCMSKQLNRLSQCKSQCRGQCQSNIASKSNSPSTKAGKAASGQPQGDRATELNSNRQQEQLTGTQGDGPSETEILQAPEGEQEAVRQYAKKYKQFRREAEAVLDSEPLPMGHRETVRTYFEAIRPSNESDL